MKDFSSEAFVSFRRWSAEFAVQACVEEGAEECVALASFHVGADAQPEPLLVGVGSAPAQTLLRRLAEATGGACVFVTPDEDPEETIVRMVERLRAPRVERVDVVWPSTPEWWTTPPTGAFAGETAHVFAGFRTPPQGDAMLQVHAHKARSGHRPDVPGETRNARQRLPPRAAFRG